MRVAGWRGQGCGGEEQGRYGGGDEVTRLRCAKRGGWRGLNVTATGGLAPKGHRWRRDWRLHRGNTGQTALLLLAQCERDCIPTVFRAVTHRLLIDASLHAYEE
eukprot:scaffold20218_cov109-Isochrysis_galbana.AAC.1